MHECPQVFVFLSHERGNLTQTIPLPLWTLHFIKNLLCRPIRQALLMMFIGITHSFVPYFCYKCGFLRLPQDTVFCFNVGGNFVYTHPLVANSVYPSLISLSHPSQLNVRLQVKLSRQRVYPVYFHPVPQVR